MPKPKLIETPERIELPFPKNKNGDYILFNSGRQRSNIDITNARRYPDGYIYFIKVDGQNVYKIGVSKSPGRRLSDINSYLPYNFTILSLHYFKGVYEIEKEYKTKYRNFLLKKEWYLLDIDTAKYIMIDLYERECINLKKK